jgi:uncharacterized protein (TIGR02391 family)
MAKSRSSEHPPPEPRDFRSTDEIDRAIAKLRRRIDELAKLDVRAAVLDHSGEDDVVRSNIRETIREVFGNNSPEFREHEHLDIWVGGLALGMSREEVLAKTQAGKRQVTTILEGLVARLEEKCQDLVSEGPRPPRDYVEDLNLHPRLADVSVDRFRDGYHWDAVFAASKALVNYVKERSDRHDLDGAPLVRTVFSRNNPILAFNDLADQTDLDEQEGMMHLFEGAVLGIRNPGGHSFPEGPEQRAAEYLNLLSLLAYRVAEAKQRDVPDSDAGAA